MTDLERLEKMRKIALELLDKWDNAERTCIWEYSFQIEEDEKIHDTEVRQIRRKIMKI